MHDIVVYEKVVPIALVRHQVKFYFLKVMLQSLTMSHSLKECVIASSISVLSDIDNTYMYHSIIFVFFYGRSISCCCAEVHFSLLNAHFAP